MAWGRLDDEFDEHDKIMALLDDHGTVGAAAIGLWTLCWSWANRNTRNTRSKKKVPGRLPRSLPRSKMGTDGVRLASLLVEYELWDVVADEAGGGWMIHDYADYLPSAEVSAKRSAAGRKGGQKKQENREKALAEALAEASAASDPRHHGNELGSNLVHPGSNEIPGDSVQLPARSNGHVLPASKTDVTPELDMSHQEPGSKELHTGSNLLHLSPHTTPARDGHEKPETAADLGKAGEVVGLHGTLALPLSNLLPGCSKNAPHTHTHTHTQGRDKDSSPAGTGGTRSRSARRSAADHSYDPGFEQFWAAYGRKGGKRAAAAEWHWALERADAQTILAAVPAYVDSTPNAKWRKDAERWLKADGWESLVITPDSGEPLPKAAGRHVVPDHNPGSAEWYDMAAGQRM